MSSSNEPTVNSLIKSCLEIYRNKPYKYKVIDFLASKGVSEEESEKIFSEVHEAYIQEKVTSQVKKNLGIWIACLILLLLTFWFFYFYVPKTNWRNSPFWTSVLGSGLLMLLLYHVVGYFGTWTPGYVRERIEKKSGFGLNYSFLFYMLLPAIVPYFLLNSKYKDEIENQLLQHSVEVEAKVVNGWSQTIPGRRGRSMELFYVMVEFKDNHGKKQEATKEVYQSEFNKFYKGQNITIVYDSLNPEKFEFLNNSKTIKKFTNAEERNLSANDLFEILEIKDSDDILEKLNSISVGWKKQQDYFVNERRIERIDLMDDAIAYSTREIRFDNAIKQFENDGYEKQEAEKSQNPFAKINLYENDTYFIEVQQKPVTDKEDYNTYLFTVISVIKK